MKEPPKSTRPHVTERQTVGSGAWTQDPRSEGGVRGAAPSTIGSPKLELLDQFRRALRSRHTSRRTEQTYVMWVKRFTVHHSLRHPAGMAEPEISAFLKHLAVNEEVRSSAQNRGCSGRSSTRASSRVRPPLIRSCVRQHFR